METETQRPATGYEDSTPESLRIVVMDASSNIEACNEQIRELEVQRVQSEDRFRNALRELTYRASKLDLE